MNLVRIIIALIGLMTICCNSNKNNTTQRQNDGANNGMSLNNEEKYLISEKGVLGLCIGDSIPNKLDHYELTESIKIVEEGIEEPVINITENNKELLQLGLEYDPGNERFINIIGEILIKDKKFRTEKNIGIESTISDFANSYPNYYLWYTYISGMYVIQSKDLKIQFLLDESGYIGNQDLIESDMIALKKEDFSADTKIIAIRIY